jgi:hypothetical protein
MPNIKSVWFPSGASFLDSTATSSWLMTLDSHETAHLYQLNAKGPVNGYLKTFFGNAVAVFFFGVPVIIHPNFFTPVFLLEGNAVLQESRIHRGGRLHSGEARAMVLSQVQAGMVDSTYLINDVFTYPFGERRYLHGGYFEAHLAAKYGIDRTNSFFKSQGDHWLWPLLLNSTFHDHFNSSYPQEIREYVRGLEGLAAKQKSTLAPPLLKSVFVSPLNHDSDRIWFSTTDGTEPVKLRIFDKKNRLVVSRSYDLSHGKVFLTDRGPEVTNSDRNDLHHITYSLYGEGRRMDPRFRGQVVSDQRAGKTASLDATHSWFESKVLINGENFDVAHSSPILDGNGNVYYFRQNGAERILYKNREPQFKFDGFYGKLTEIGDDGTIYFIANTDYGSTLYRYKEQEISRVFDSDRVIDARQISANEFLAVEVDADGHSVHLLAPSVKPATPAVYSYGFTTENVTPEKAVAPEQIQADEKPYNGLTALRFSALDFNGGYASDYGAVGGIVGSFSDPLEYHQMALGVQGSSLKDRAYDFIYSYSRYLVDWNVHYRYTEDWWEKPNSDKHQIAYHQDVGTGFRIPLYRGGNWDAAAAISLDYEHYDTHGRRPDVEETYGARSRAEVKYEVQTPLALIPWREFSLAFDHKITTPVNAWEKDDNAAMVSSVYRHGMPKNFYVSAFGNVAWSERPEIDVRYTEMPWPTDISIPMLTYRDSFLVKNAESLRLEIHKLIKMQAYSNRIPIGIDRIAPFVVAQGVAFDDSAHDDYPHSDFEWGYGADLQVLIIHNLHSMVRILNAYNTSEPNQSRWQAQLSIKQNF